ncbi:hypothetical protein U3516DRAFT_789984, partial [Neocallimastix sp. 'constans']
MSQKIGNVQKEFDEVAYTIHNNVNKLAERGEKVYSLQIKSEEFNEYSKQYKYN